MRCQRDKRLRHRVLEKTSPQGNKPEKDQSTRKEKFKESMTWKPRVRQMYQEGKVDFSNATHKLKPMRAERRPMAAIYVKPD